ncbi:MAG: tetratricopeptide repeat-containing protein, partial [Bacteroidota bacterium]
MTELQTNLSNAGIFAIQDKAYADAYANASKGLEMHEYLKTLGAESILDDEKRFEDETYYAAVSALLVEDYAAAKPLYSKLVEMEYEDASIYDGMYKIAFAEGNKEQAVEHLNKGRELFPDDTQLLFTEINYYLGEKKLDVLIGKLENAIAKEPNNVSLYATLGSVYDNLYQKEAKEGNEEKATEYFSSAKEYYEKALEIKPDYASAIYSIGALYFNRGAAMTQELQELGDDFSKEGQKKYEALKTKVDEEFELALPYFKKAEQSDPNDLNILIALKEIYAR